MSAISDLLQNIAKCALMGIFVACAFLGFTLLRPHDGSSRAMSWFDRILGALLFICGCYLSALMILFDN